MSNVTYEQVFNHIQRADSHPYLDQALKLFQNEIRKNSFTPAEIQTLVDAGKAKRSALPPKPLQIQTPVEREGNSQQAFSPRDALAKAKVQGPGGVPSFNPHTLGDDDRDLYLLLSAVDCGKPDSFKDLEILELRYAEREREPKAKEALLTLFAFKMDAYAKAHPERFRRQKEGR